MSGKAFVELTPSGRLRRFRAVARDAVAAYGFAGSELSLLTHHENVTFSVRTPRPPERHLLRIHRPGYQTAVSIESELCWLRALHEDGVAVVPRPVAAADGYVAAVAPFLCSFLRWVPGRRLLRAQQPAHYRQLGRLTAMLHDHGRSWTPPPSFARPAWDADGLLGRRPHLVAADDAWSLVPSGYRPLMQEVAARFTEATERLGRSREVFGLIHGDLHFENVVFAGGRAQPIDFDDCGFGWFTYDLAAAAQLFPPYPDAAARRAAFVAGYREVRQLDDEQLRFLGVMRAARLAALALWLLHRAASSSAIRVGLPAWMDSGRRQVESLLKEPR